MEDSEVLLKFSSQKTDRPSMKKGAEQLSELNLVFEDEEVEKKSDAIAIVTNPLPGIKGRRQVACKPLPECGTPPAL